jgi:hypothetical protein
MEKEYGVNAGDMRVMEIMERDTVDGAASRSFLGPTVSFQC